MTGAPPLDLPVEIVELEDEKATEALARWLARFAKPGDFLVLGGELGAGKTALARAFLREATGQAHLETPSPTYTLAQSYEGREGHLVHADFYRLKTAEDLAQIGWSEMIDGAVALVEWGERIASALPAERLDITLEFDPAHGPDRRLALFRPRGLAMPGRFKSARAVEKLLDAAGWAEARREPVAGDASSRAYERLTDDAGRTAILMIAPPRPPGPPLRFGRSYPEIARLSSDIRAYLAVGEGLRSLGLSVPKIYAQNVADGLALIEDFGSETIADASGVNPSRYTEAAALLADLHHRVLPTELPFGAEIHTLPVYDLDAMLIEVELALDWYAPAVARGAPSSGARMQFLGLWREILAPALAEPVTWTLRDYHSPNIYWLPERQGVARLGLIDFQDMVLGPGAYDVASLLQDARQHVPEDLEARLLAHYMRRRAQLAPGFDTERFVWTYSVMGAQRATKILGIFTRLDRRDGKPQYLKLLPRIEQTLARNLAHPALEPLYRWFETHLPRALGAAAREPRSATPETR
jgi:tRNA threonylcarbamoyl adenosine modification protein YjeE